MSWERGYYYRARKVNGRVVKEYVGAGQVAELAADLDNCERAERERQRAADRADRAEVERLAGAVVEFNDLAESLARAALLASGYHQHKRGEWRKRREQRENEARAGSGRTPEADATGAKRG